MADEEEVEKEDNNNEEELEEIGEVGLEDEIEDKNKQKKEAIIRDVGRIKKTKKVNKKAIILSIIGIIVITALVLLILYMKQKEKTIKLEEDKPVEIKKKDITKKEFKSMVNKAEEKYDSGDKREALLMYEKLSKYTYSISHYNLGVSYMKTKEYKKALDSFKQSIQLEDNFCISAINAAVCALELKDEKLFKYYIELAYAYLPKSTNDPLYNLYFALVMYYQQNYIEAVAVLKHMNEPTYDNIKQNMLSNIFLLLDSNIDAIKHIEKIDAFHPRDLYKGLLYAKIGEYNLALDYLKIAEEQKIDLKKTLLAIAYIYMKKGAYIDATTYLQKAYKIYNTSKDLAFGIKFELIDSLIFIDESQHKILSNIKKPNKQRIFEILFYFAPYKMFNAGKSISYFKKGIKNLYVDEIQRAKKDYKQSLKTTLYTEEILKGIRLAIDHQTRKARDIFINLVEQVNEDSIFYYNLALSYAQLGNFEYSYKYFRKSFYIDKTNIISGIFAIMTARLSNITNYELDSKVRESITKYSEDTKRLIFYRAMHSLIDGSNFKDSIEHIEKGSHSTTLRTATALLSSIIYKKDNYSKKIALNLKDKLPDDIVANILYFNSKNSYLDIKKFAQNAAIFLQEKSLDINSLYHGPNISRKMYIELAKISGLGYTVRDVLKEKIITNTKDTIGVLQSLALTDLHLGFYEESYTLYNKLIDDLNQKDPETLFLASIASIGSGHFSNAAVLLKLVNIKNKTNYEARLALALLFLQNGNLKSATTQTEYIKSNNFKSEYFDFKIDNKNFRRRYATKDSNTTK